MQLSSSWRAPVDPSRDLRRSVKLAWWPGHSTGRYAGSTWFADAFAQDLDRNCLAQINCDSPGCRWATSYHDTRSFSECAELASGAIRDVVPDAEIATLRPPQAGDYSFNNIGLSSFFMLSSTMPDALRQEKHYYDVSGCGGNIAWHTENDTLEIADRDDPAEGHEDLSAVGAADRERRGAAIQLGGDVRRVPRHDRRDTKTRRKAWPISRRRAPRPRP